MSSPFHRIEDSNGHWVEILVDDQTIRALEGESVAAALLAAGLRSCRTTPVSGAPRAPYCMMGICFECLVAHTTRQDSEDR